MRSLPGGRGGGKHPKWEIDPSQLTTWKPKHKKRIFDIQDTSISLSAMGRRATNLRTWTLPVLEEETSSNGLSRLYRKSGILTLWLLLRRLKETSLLEGSKVTSLRRGSEATSLCGGSEEVSWRLKSPASTEAQVTNFARACCEHGYEWDFFCVMKRNILQCRTR